MSLLSQALTDVQAVLQPDIKKFFTEYRARSEVIDEWSVFVLDRIEEYCLRPGKAVRPLLVAVGAALSRQISLQEAWQDPAVRQAMLIVQLKHKRIIMIDDISDQDEMRNGKPAFHVFWRQDLAQLPSYQRLSPAKLTHISRSYTEVAGMWLDSQSFWALGSPVFTEVQRINLLNILQEHTYDKTAAGWYIIFDQSFEAISDEMSEERLIKGLELVSGEYTFVGPLRFGAALSNPSKELETTLRGFGQAAGILFQITDDVIGAFGDPKVTGKPVGGDFREGKKTLLVQYAYRRGSKQQKKKLKQLIGKEDITQEEVFQVQEIMEQTGAREYALEQASAYAQQALESIQALPEAAEKQLLTELVQFIQQREK
jgi:geranylgeranyl diphosphate synthase type I